MTDHRTAKDRLGPWAMFSLVFCITTGYGILIGPSLVIAIARESTSVINLIGFTLTCALLAIGVWLANQFPHMTVVQWVKGLLGPLGYIWSIALIAYVIVFLVFQIHYFAALLHLLFLTRTPKWILLAGVAGTVAYGASLGIDAISRFFRLAIFLELTALPILLLAGMREVNIPLMLPIFPREPHVWLQGPVYAVASYMGFLYPPLMLRQVIDSKQSILWPCLTGLIVSGVMIFGVSVGVLGTFGADAVEHLLFPIFDFMEVITLPKTFEFLTRYTPYFAIVWVLAVLKVGMISLHVAAHGTEQLLGIRGHRRLTPWLFGLTLLGGAFIPNAHVGKSLLTATALIGVPVAIVNTVVLGLLVLLMRRRAQRVAAANNKD